MSRQISELETVLQGLIAEHRKLLLQVDTQQVAMKAFDLNAMDKALQLQEATRLRIVGLENRRRLLAQQLGQLYRLGGNATLAELASRFPQQGPGLLKMRDDLKDLIVKIQLRSNIAARVAGAVLGHLNTAVRLLAGAVDHTGLYTKNGVPQGVRRIGVMEAVG